MSEQQLHTPVAFFVFNRPESTARVFAEIARARPRMLLVVADGPREDRSGEVERCRAARAVVERMDWDCEVLTRFADTNLGCKRRLSSGLDWVFDTVEQAIILEDDCLPHPSFFRFCAELLDWYRDDPRVAMIGGTSFQPPARRNAHSYHFSRYTHVWGWASWRRAWQHYDVAMNSWPYVAREGRIPDDLVTDTRAAEYWRKIFDSVHRGEIDTWDYQWLYACWLQGALSVIPGVNLVSNIGFGPEATHTGGWSPYAAMPRREMRFPLRHPPQVVRDAAADRYTQEMVFGTSNWLVRRGRKAYRMLQALRES
jgi:hypothetical protein